MAGNVLICHMRNFFLFHMFLFCIVSVYSQDLLDGLVGYYSFCGCEASDQSGNGNDGILIGTPQCIDGIKGQGFEFNTNPVLNDCGQLGGEYIQLPTFDAIWENGISVCAWIKYENLSHFERIIDLGNGNGESGGMPIWFGREGNSNNLTLESWISDDADVNRSIGRLVANNVITNGRIEFYSFTIDGVGMSIYVNGELVAQKAGHRIANVSRSNNFLGRSNWCEADPDFKGFMDEVRIYNRALSPEEMRIMYASPFQVDGRTKYNVCVGESVQLELQGGESYRWSPDPTLNSTDVSNPIATPLTSTIYSCEIFFPDGCSFTENVLVDVRDDVFTTIDVEICEEEEYFDYNMPGTYTDTLISEFGCDSVRTVNLSVVPRPAIMEDVTICVGDDFKGFTVEGVYVDTISAPGCDTFRTIRLTVSNPQIVDLTIIPESCEAMDGSLEWGITEIQGDFTEQLNGNTSFDPNQLSAGDYLISVIDEYGCSTDTLVSIPRTRCPVFIPNAFSPNEDGYNDFLEMFSSSSEEITILNYVIFDRWGSMVYRAENFALNDGQDYWWQGKYGTSDVQVGVYVYLIEIAYSDGDRELVTGDILITR